MNIFHLTDVLFAASLVLTVLALYDRLQEGSSGLVRIATVYGLGSAVLLLATGFISVFAVSALAGLYPQNQAGAGLAWRAVDSMLGGMQKAQLFAYGWWILLVSWAALKGGGLPRPLNYVGLLLGVMAGIIGMATDSAGLTQLVLVVIWNLWLGVVLLRG